MNNPQEQQPRKTAYPETAGLEQDIENMIEQTGISEAAATAVREIVLQFKEFEHGTASVQDIHPDLTLPMYRAACFEIALTVGGADI